MQLPRPFVFINVAASADGKLDTVERRGAGISSPADKQRVQELRAGSDAIMVGGHTLIAEDPRLTVKTETLRQARAARGLPEHPARVGVTGQTLPRPDGAFINGDPARRVIFTTSRADPAGITRLRDSGVEVFIHGENQVDLPASLQTLHALGMRRLMVEGGGTLNFELLRLGLVDEIHIFLAPVIFGGAGAPTLADGPGLNLPASLALKLLEVRALDKTGGLHLHYQVIPV